MKKKYQVFISSTYTDLIEERKAVQDAVLKMHQIPVGMEQFNASDAEQWEVIREAIDSTDYYVLILGKRYGSVIEVGEDAGISYTEKEFNYAKSQGVPILAYIKSDNASFKGTDFETNEEKHQKLEDFKVKVKTGRIVEWFHNKDHLAAMVTASLHNEIRKNDRPGWIRATQTDTKEELSELIELLRQELLEEPTEDEEWDKPIVEFEFSRGRVPTDGNHREINFRGRALSEGEYRDGKLIHGTEYDVLIQVTNGQLFFKPDCPEDPYDCSNDFEYVTVEQLWCSLLPHPIEYSENEIICSGVDGFYVVDMNVDEETEQMTNIRTLEAFLLENDPEELDFIIKMRE